MMGIPFPSEYGGSGGDWVGMHICIEEISRARSHRAGCWMSLQARSARNYMSLARKTRKRSGSFPWPGKGDRGIRPHGAGSGFRCRGHKDHGIARRGRVGHQRNQAVHHQYRSRQRLHRNYYGPDKGTEARGEDIINTFIVPKGTPGFSLGKKYDKMGWKQSATHECIFELPHSRGQFPGAGGQGFRPAFSRSRDGPYQHCGHVCGNGPGLPRSIAEVRQGKGPVRETHIQFPGVSFKLADMAMHIELARNMYLKAAWLKDNKMPHTLEAAYAKLFASEMCEKCASDAFQIHGGYGFMNEYAVSRYYKNCKILQIVEGASRSSAW